MSEFVHYNMSASHSSPKELKTALSSSEANFVDVNWFAVSPVELLASTSSSTPSLTLE